MGSLGTIARRFLALSLLVTAVTACDPARMAARSSAHLAKRSGPGFEEYWDYELAGDAMPATIMQLEAMVRVAPDNDVLVLRLIRVYVGYAYGWVEDRAEEFELAQDFSSADEQRRRAKYMYLRARDLAFYMLRDKHPQLDHALAGGEAGLEAWLASTYRRPRDAELLFWAGSAWGSYIGASRDDMSAAADLPYARAFLRRSVALDPGYQHAAGLAALGAIEASMPDGDPTAARHSFDEALERTERRSLAIQVQMANTYAVQAPDRALYVALLREVLEAGDVLPEARLANRVAKRRAARYLRQVDTRFTE